ncbi:MAG: hypothetical protein EOR00_24260 [Mesorhizobium sp.]|uniref:hypothetical protein n=1 Tax=Mesorhizobium sp. TaxID=1871066 RepID=UPI000FE7DAFE|nr:hypothetical protein [Mesorhizobium sp.]RWP13956.1 MAG: hypothetical protein EOR00_24260 [Mesorhizobium sp.]
MKNANNKKSDRNEMVRFLLSRRFPNADGLIGDLISDAIDVPDDIDEVAGDAAESDGASDFTIEQTLLILPGHDVAPPVELVSYLKNLERLSLSELSAAYEAEKDKDRPFSQSSSYADFDVWLGKDHLSLEEAVALSHGLEPTKVNLARLEEYTASPFAIAFRARHDDLQRYANREKINGLTVTGFKAWMKKKSLEFPPNWPASNEKAEAINSAGGDDFHHGTRDLFYKLLMAVCMKEFGYKPLSKADYDPHITSKVRNYIKSYKFHGVSEKTVREHIRAAEQHFAKSGFFKVK